MTVPCRGFKREHGKTQVDAVAVPATVSGELTVQHLPLGRKDLGRRGVEHGVASQETCRHVVHPGGRVNSTERSVRSGDTENGLPTRGL